MLPKELTKKGSKARLTWTPQEVECFELLKSKIVDGLSLQTVCLEKLFILRVDASDYAVAAAL